MKRIHVIVILTCFLLLLSACAKETAEPVKESETVHIRMTITGNLSYGPIFIARAEGFWEDYGIEMEYVTFDKASEAIALLAANKIDVYAGTVNAGLINMVVEGNAIKIVADRGHVDPNACTYQAILIRKDLVENGTVKGAADLKGMKFSASTAGPSAYLLSSYLAQGNLTFDDIEIVDIPSSAEMDGYKTKEIAGSVAPEPDLSRILDTGDAVILASAEDVLGLYQSSIVAFGSNLLVDNPEAGIRFLAGYLKGIAQYNEGKTERNLQIMADATGESTDFLKQACWVPVNLDGSVDFASIDKFQQWSISMDQLDKPVTAAQFLDMSLIEEAMKLVVK